MDLLNEVNQQLEEIGEIAEEKEEKGGARRAPTRSTPETTATFSRINFPTTSPNKSTVSPSKIHLVGNFSFINGLTNLINLWLMFSITYKVFFTLSTDVS